MEAQLREGSVSPAPSILQKDEGCPLTATPAARARGQGPLPALYLSSVTTGAVETPRRTWVINSGDSQPEGL